MESDSLLTNSGTLNFFGRRRSINDVLPLIVFVIFILIWISIGSYAFSTGDITKIISFNVWHENVQIFTIASIFMTIVFSLLAGLLTSSVLGIAQWLPNITHLTLIVVWLPFFASLTLSLRPDIKIGLASLIKHIDLLCIFATLSTFCSAAMTLYLVREMWFHLPEAILKEAARAIATFPTALVFTTLWHLLCILIFVVSIAVQLFLYGIPAVMEYTPLSRKATNALTIVNIFCFGWLFMFTFGICQMSLCKMFAIWFWTSNKEDLPNFVFLRCLKYTVRYHLGTIAYATSIFGILRSLRTILNYVIYEIREGINANFCLFFVYNLLDGLVLRFVMYNAILQCSIYGRSYHQSVEDSMNSLFNHPKQCLLMSKMTEWILLLAVSYVSMFMFFPVASYFVADFRSRSELVILIPMLLSYLIFVLPMIALLLAALSTILICTLEDRNSNGSTNRPYYMSARLILALDGRGPRTWMSCC